MTLPKIKKFDDTLEIIKAVQNGVVMVIYTDKDGIMIYHKNEIYNWSKETMETNEYSEEWNIQVFLWKYRYSVNRAELHDSYDEVIKDLSCWD